MGEGVQLLTVGTCGHEVQLLTVDSWGRVQLLTVGTCCIHAHGAGVQLHLDKTPLVINRHQQGEHDIRA